MSDPTFTITDEERQFLAYVKTHKGIGYGRMMQMISHAWYRYTERTIGTGEGAQLANTCVAFLSERDKQAYLELLEMGEAQGMEY